MKIQCLQENLAKALNAVSKIIPIRGSLPILSNVLLKTENGRLKIIGTNLEIGVRYLIGAKIEEEGEITIPSKLFAEYINSLPNDKIDLSLKENNLIIKSNDYNAKVFGTDTKEFPLIPEVKNEPITILKADQFLESINQVVFAAALDETRPILSGVYFHFEGDKLRMVATDSYRLSEKTIKLGKPVKEAKSVIVPAKTIQELNYVVSENEKPVEISIDENQILFRIADIDLISRLIEGEFPNYEQIIPESFETRAKINVEEFIKVIKLANIFAREGTHNVQLELKKDGKIIVSTATAQVGDNVSTLKSEIEGNESEITFNTKYLLDVLSNIKTKSIYLELNGKLNPGVIKSEGLKDYTHIIMPLRT